VSNTNMDTPNPDMSEPSNSEGRSPGPDVLTVREPAPLDTTTEHEAITPPGQLSRRRFLHRLSIGLAGAGAIAVGVPVAAFMVGPLLQPVPVVWRAVGEVGKFKVGETVQVSFEDASPQPWAGVTARTAAWLRRENDTNFIAFAVNCTHLGCPVSWLSGAQLFLCPCHGGVYYQDGVVAAGPPPLPLFRYDVRIRNGQVEVRASGTPIPTA
jgi:menaquinol-cytochrome c reductase iron-sulfur subunit